MYVVALHTLFNRIHYVAENKFHTFQIIEFIPKDQDDRPEILIAGFLLRYA